MTSYEKLPRYFGIYKVLGHDDTDCIEQIVEPYFVGRRLEEPMRRREGDIRQIGERLEEGRRSTTTKDTFQENEVSHNIGIVLPIGATSLQSNRFVNEGQHNLNTVERIEDSSQTSQPRQTLAHE